MVRRFEVLGLRSKSTNNKVKMMEKDRINEIRDAVEKVGEEIKALQEKQGSLNRRELFLEINKLRG